MSSNSRLEFDKFQCKFVVFGPEHLEPYALGFGPFWILIYFYNCDFFM